jgi:hypothetical protein
MNAIKFSAPDTVEGLAIPFGSAKSRDLDGEFFTADTDLCIEWFGQGGRPSLYDHGIDGKMRTTVIGRQVDHEVREEGVWASVQLDRAAQYRKTVDELIEQGALGFSSGAMPHLATKSRNGQITRWPWVELSLTPIPAHPGTVVHYVKSADALAHLREAGTVIPEGLTESALKALDEWADARALGEPPDGLTYAEHFDRVLVDARALAERGHDISMLRAKAGRVLSSANRQRLATLRDRIRDSSAQAADVLRDLDELLASTDPEAEKSSALMAVILEAEATRARLFGATID